MSIVGRPGLERVRRRVRRLGKPLASSRCGRPGMKATLGFVGACVVTTAMTAASAADWPQYRGPQRDGVSLETGLLKEWPAGGPPLLWSYDELGIGYAGPASSATGSTSPAAAGDEEYVFALDLPGKGGTERKEVWSAKIGPLFTWRGNSGTPGPTPRRPWTATRLYALGGFGDLVCVEAATGRSGGGPACPATWAARSTPSAAAWRSPRRSAGAIPPRRWLTATASSACRAAGRASWRRSTRRRARFSGGARRSPTRPVYSSPLVVEVGGVRQYVQVTNKGIVGVAAATGRRLWSYRRSRPSTTSLSPPRSRMRGSSTPRSASARAATRSA